MDSNTVDASPPKGAYRLCIRQGQPTIWEEVDVLSLTTDQSSGLRKRVVNYLRAYLRAANSLAEGKYAEVSDLIPLHLREPMSAIVIFVDNGVIVRYERSEKKIVGSAAFEGSIDKVALLLSDNLAVFGSAPAEPQDVGVHFRLMKGELGSPGCEIFYHAIITYQSPATPSNRSSAIGTRPNCTMSIHNALDLRLGLGLVMPNQPDDAITHLLTSTRVRLPVPWEAFEVYPHIHEDEWNVDLAPVWAERDIEAGLLRQALKERILGELDPNAATRRALQELLSSFKMVLDSNPEKEEILQQFLAANPLLLCPSHRRVYPKLHFGKHITDFVIQSADGSYLLVELEPSVLPLFTKKNNPTARLTTAMSQVVDWKRYIEDNRATVVSELGLGGISSNPEAVIVMGRRRDLTEYQVRKLTTMFGQAQRIRIRTYDDIYDDARQTIDNLVGLFGESAGATRTYRLPTHVDDAMKKLESIG